MMIKIHCADFTQYSKRQAKNSFYYVYKIQLNLIKGLTKSSMAFWYLDIILVAWNVMFLFFIFFPDMLMIDLY